YSASEFGLTAFFLSLFFLLFALAPHLVRLNQKMQTGSFAARDVIALILLPLANAALGFLGFYFLVGSIGSFSAQPWIAVAFAAFYLFLLRVPLFPAERHIPAALRSLDLTIAVAFLTIAIPLKTHGRWLTIGWLVEGAALLWLSRMQSQRMLRSLSGSAHSWSSTRQPLPPFFSISASEPISPALLSSRSLRYSPPARIEQA